MTLYEPSVTPIEQPSNPIGAINQTNDVSQTSVNLPRPQILRKEMDKPSSVMRGFNKNIHTNNDTKMTNESNNENEIKQSEITLSSFRELIRQRNELDKQIAEQLQFLRPQALSQAIGLIKEFHFTQEDFFNESNAGHKNSMKAVAKYKDPDSQKTWNGHGKTPNWIAKSGKPKEDFLISKQEPQQTEQ